MARTQRAGTSQARVRRQHRGGGWFGLFLAVILLAGSVIAVIASQPAHRSAPEVPGVHPFSSHAPDHYKGPTEAPSLKPSTLAVPSVGIDVPILEEPAENGYIKVPSSPDSNRVAHYDATAPLGSKKGSTFLVGHVNQMDGSPAPMARLGGVSRGAAVFIADTAGVVHRYKVTSLSIVRKDEAPSSWFSTTTNAQLVLVTCDQNSTYSVLAGVEQYNDYTAVTAIPWP